MDIEKTKTNPPREKLLHLWNSVHGIVSSFHVGDSKLAEEHERRIRHHYNQLLSNLNVPGVVAQMFQSGKLTLKEHEHLRQFHSTPIRASEELLNIIIINSQDVYECFLESLKETRQHHVYQMLASDENIDDQSISEHSRIIRQNYDWLTEKLDLDSGLLSILYAKKVLSQREHSHIFYEREPFVKNENLLSIISRKSVDEYENFKIALNKTSQEHVTKRLEKTPVGDETQSEPKKEPPKSPSSKQMVTKPIPKTDPSKPNRMKKPEHVTEHRIVRKQSVEYLEAKLKQLPNELQTEISAKMFLIHQSTSTASRPIWAISITKILEESRSIRTQNMVQAQAADEKCERLMQEITGTKKQLGEKHETINELEDRLTCVLEKLKASESNVGRLTEMNQQKEEEAGVKESKIEELKAQVTNSEINLKETEAQLKDTKYQLTENVEALKQTSAKLAESQEMLKETKVKKNEFEAKLTVTEKRIDDLALLNQLKEQEVDEKVSIIEKLQSQTIQSEDQLKQMRTQIESTEVKFKENELYLESTSEKLRETQEKLKEMETKQSESEAKLKASEKGSDNSKSEGMSEKCLDLEQKLEHERTEKDRLKELNQEYKRIIDEIRSEYKLYPDLVQTIRTKAAEVGKKSINGLTILDNELFVVSEKSSEVEVYDSMKFSFSRRWDLKELTNPWDIGSCNRNKCLYIFDFKVSYAQTKDVLRVDPNGQLILQWSTGKGYGLGLSVTDESNVLLTVYNENKLHEYSPDGQLIREINLALHARIHDPFHAIKLTNGHFVVSHGDTRDDLHRVCIVDADGKLKRLFGGKFGSTIGQMNRPFYLSVDGNGFVMVADERNSRVLLLDSDLKFKREILSNEEKFGLRIPRRILLDETNGRLFVADNESNNQRILVFDCR